MIKINQLLKTLPKYQNVLIEESFASLDTHVDPARKARASSINRTKFESIDQSIDGHARTHWKVNSQSDSSKQYNVVVEIIVPMKGGLFALAKEKWQPKLYKDVLTKSDVRVHCNCYDFYWSGMMHNNGPSGNHKGSLATGLSTLVPNAQTNPSFPKVRDPSGNLSMCKHLHSVFKYFPTNAFDIMSQVRKFNNTITVDTDKTEKVDDGKQPLEIIQEPPERKRGDSVTIPTEEKAPILDSLYEVSQQMDQMVQDNASNVINDVNKTVDEENTPEVEHVPASDLIQDETDAEYVPREQPVSNVIQQPTEPKKIEADTNKILGDDTEPEEIENNIKKVSVNDIMNPSFK